jgi:hypothetical protein
MLIFSDSFPKLRTYLRFQPDTWGRISYILLVVVHLKFIFADPLFTSWPLIDSNIKLLPNSINETYKIYDTIDGFLHCLEVLCFCDEVLRKFMFNWGKG